MEGWIKLHRQFLSWEWFDDPLMVKLFLYLLLSANHEKKKWKGTIVKRGQLITGLSSLNKDTGISIRSLRTCLAKLEKTGEIDRQSDNRFTIITICNYDSYQQKENNTDKQSDKRPTSDRQATDNKQEEEEYKKKKSVGERKAEFKNSLHPYLEKYGRDMLNDFYSYWTEHGENDKKMRFEKEKSFSLSRRLSMWKRNENKFNEKNRTNNRNRFESDTTKGAIDGAYSRLTGQC